ncbi:MAG: hypothetical protein ACRCUF_06545, partial [Aeromonas sobria]
PQFSSRFAPKFAPKTAQFLPPSYPISSHRKARTVAHSNSDKHFWLTCISITDTGFYGCHLPPRHKKHPKAQITHQLT